MGKTRDLFKKIRDTKGTFHTKMGSIKDRNCMNLTEAEDIKKRWHEHTEEPYKKDLHDQDNNDGVITHLEPDILECEVKWALGSIGVNKASGEAQRGQAGGSVHTPGEWAEGSGLQVDLHPQPASVPPVVLRNSSQME